MIYNSAAQWRVLKTFLAAQIELKSTRQTIASLCNKQNDLFDNKFLLKWLTFEMWQFSLEMHLSGSSC